MKQFFQSHLQKIGLVIIILALLAIGGYVLRSQQAASFTLTQTSFDQTAKSIPVNAKTLTFTFSHPLDPQSITPQTVMIQPSVKTELKVENNILTLQLKQPLDEEKQYVVTVGQDIKTKNGQTLSQVYSFDLNVVGEATVVKITPSGSLQALDQNIAVFFNVPMVPLTNLDMRDNLPCPITISPAIEGTCKWTTTSVVEFEPKEHLHGATTYVVNVQPQSGLQYDFEAKNIHITTPDLHIYVDDTFDPQKGMILQFNFPIEKSQLNDLLTLTKKGTVIPHTITAWSGSETRFLVTPKDGGFRYDQSYRLNIAAGLSPKYGTEPMRSRNKTIASESFIKGITLLRTIYDTGRNAINVRTVVYNDNAQIHKMNTTNSYLPIKDIMVRIYFADEVALNNQLIYLETKAGKRISSKLSYVPEEVTQKDGTIIQQDNKKKVKLTLQEDLPLSSEIILHIDKHLHQLASQTITKKYQTPPAFEIKKAVLKDYKTACVYTTTPIEQYDYQEQEMQNDWRNYVTITPHAQMRNVIIESYGSYDQPECPEKTGLIAHRLQPRLNPDMRYTMTIAKGLTDRYGSTLSHDYVFSGTTSKIRTEDKYLYGANKYLNVIPAHVPLNVNIQTMNLETAKIEVCRMNIEQLVKFLPSYSQIVGKNKRGYDDYQYFGNSYLKYKPDDLCVSHSIEDVSLRNLGRNLSNNIVSIDTKIDNALSPLEQFVYVKVTKPGEEALFNKDGNGFEQLYFQSSYSIAYEKAGNDNILFVTDLSGHTVTDVSFLAYHYDDHHKTYEVTPIQPKQEGKVFRLSGKDLFDILIVYNKQGMGFLNTKTDDFNNYDFGYVAGHSTSQHNFGYLYTDRPIYKPGDTVSFKALLRTFTPTGYLPTKVDKGTLLVTYTKNNKTLTTIPLDVDKYGHINGTFSLPSAMDLGQLRFERQYHKGSNKQTLRFGSTIWVEEYIKPTLNIEVQKGNGKKQASVESDNALTVGDTLDLTITPTYYFGGKVTNTEGKYEVLTQKYYFDAKDYQDYQFGDGYEYYNCLYRGECRYDDNGYRPDDSAFTIGSNGQFRYTHTFPKKEGVGERIYSYIFQIMDPDTKQRISKTVSKVVHTTDAYIGLQVPYWNNKKDGIKVGGIILNTQAKPVANTSAEVKIYQTEWERVKKQGIDGYFYYKYDQKETLLSTKKVKSDKNGAFDFVYTPQQGGDYKIVATYKGTNGMAFHSTAMTYVSDGSFHMRNTDNNSVTDVVVDHHRCKVGETQSMTIKSPVNRGKMLVLIEKDDGILDYRVQDVDSYAPRITFPIKQSYYPNVYTKVFLIGTQDNNPLPIYKRALAVTKIDTDYKRLRISLTTDKTIYQPRQKISLTVKVRDAQGNPVPHANGSVAIVDQSVLALMGNPKKNPYAYFYDMKRYLGTVMYGSLKFLVEKLEVRNPQDGSKGGDGNVIKGGDSMKKRGIFKDTARRKANFETDEYGVATLTSASLPDNLTTREIETLIITPTDNKIGVAYTTVKSAKKVMINDNLPQFLGAGDIITLRPVVFNHLGKNATFVVTFTGTHIMLQDGETATKKVTINDGASVVVPFTIHVEPNTHLSVSQQSRITFSAATDGGEDVIEKYLQIQPTSVMESVGTFGSVDVGKKDSSIAQDNKADTTSSDEQLDLTDIIHNPGTLIITYAPTLFSSVLASVDFLENYAYGCLEQRISALMPNILIKHLYNSAQEPFDLTKKFVNKWKNQREGYQKVSIDSEIKTQLAMLDQFQTTDGGFAYWKDSYNAYYHKQCASFDLTNYVIASVGQMKNLGYAVNQSVMKQSLHYAKDMFYRDTYDCCTATESNNHCNIPEYQRLETINALLTYNPQDYEAYKMRQKITTHGTLLHAQVIGKLVQIDALSKEIKNNLRMEAKDVLDQVINNDLVFTPKGSYLGKAPYRSRLETTAKFLEIVANVGLETFSDSQQITQNIIRRLMKQKKDGHRGSTQDNIHVLHALIAYLEASGELKNVQRTITATLNSKEVSKQSFGQQNKFEVITTGIDFDQLQASNTFNITKKGKGPAYYELLMQYYQPSRDIDARNEGFMVKKSYYRYQDYLTIKSAKQAERKKYLAGDIAYTDLQYPKEVISYLKPVNEGNVGDLLLVSLHIVTNKTRDHVALDSYIPAGAVLINTHIATNAGQTDEEDKTQNDTRGDNEYQRGGYIPSYSNNNQSQRSEGRYFDANYDEYRIAKYFAYKDVLQPGIYETNFVMRLTHPGRFHTKPTQVFEFYDPEVFGRTAGEEFVVKE